MHDPRASDIFEIRYSLVLKTRGRKAVSTSGTSKLKHVSIRWKCVISFLQREKVFSPDT